ncbi:BhlA/UviB family holin-like peptide [Clostridium sp. Marseille-Q2269]|uniref:BhlA/UviB family holin-like peptide n=1 Tax=Clostridium sp. Marseille-Q2269 TaxID=2942205 RepID=UPI0020733FF6|nr:BhlA/UviB family holin-like peptide [Clostridium sp. Marseille-Q2269]
MEEQILKIIASQGAFAILFSYLLFYVLRENSKREEKYQQNLEKFSECMKKIENDIEHIEEIVDKHTG